MVFNCTYTLYFDKISVIQVLYELMILYQLSTNIIFMFTFNVMCTKSIKILFIKSQVRIQMSINFEHLSYTS